MNKKQKEQFEVLVARLIGAGHLSLMNNGETYKEVLKAKEELRKFYEVISNNSSKK